jgi:multidrug efflux pump subunit AcrA (membrane-fusion protein)
MKKILSACLPVCLVLMFSACRPAKQDETAAKETPLKIPVKTAPVVRGKISETLSYTGTLEAWRKINIVPEAGGKVAKIHVEEGQRVPEGTLLAEMDTTSLELQFK